MRPLISLLAFLVLAAPAQARVCHGQVPSYPPIAQERWELHHYVQERASYGFRHDLPFIQSLIARREWADAAYELPATPAENRYLRLRNKLTLGTAAERYLNDHLDVGTFATVKDDFPRRPYLLVGFTRDVKQHLAALKRLARFPRDLRARRVPLSAHERDRLIQRVQDDWRTLEKAGFYLGTEDEAAQRLEFKVVTRRHDARAYFRAHYGPLVRVRVIGRSRTQIECANASRYKISRDGRTLTVWWNDYYGTWPLRVELSETAQRVVVGPVQRRLTDRGIDRDDDVKTLKVRLAAPLGDRPVFNAGSGRPVLQEDPSPGDPPCPQYQQPSEFDQLTRARAELGLPSDPETVRARLADHGFPTADEERWYRKQAALEQENGAVSHYLLVHRDEYGGKVHGSTYPAPPSIVYRFTANAAAHEAALKRLVRHPEALRTETVGYTLRQLQAISDRIWRDAWLADGFLGGYGRSGFYFSWSSADEYAGVVDVNVVATRPDAASYFTARYGPLVRVETIGDRYECEDRYSLTTSPT